MVHENDFEYATQKPHILSNSKFPTALSINRSLSGSTLPVQPPNKNSFAPFYRNQNCPADNLSGYSTIISTAFRSILYAWYYISFQGTLIKILIYQIRGYAMQNMLFPIPLESFTYNGYAQIAFYHIIQYMLHIYVYLAY